MSFKAIKRNGKEILSKYGFLISIVFTAISFVMLFITWEDFGINSLLVKVLIFSSIVILLGCISCVWIMITRKHVVWAHSGGKIQVCYGDIVKEGFPQKKVENKIIIITVNTAFDTIVDEDVVSFDKPLVAPTSIHGQWLEQMQVHGKTIDEIDSLIEQGICNKGIKPEKILTRGEKARGKLKCYPMGTIVTVSGEDGVTYLLLAMSEFNENNQAESSKTAIINCLYEVLEEYDRWGQGFAMYIPLMGTSRSRVNLRHTESLQMIKSFFLLYCHKVHGTINIMIRDEDKEQVSIFD